MRPTSSSSPRLPAWRDAAVDAPDAAVLDLDAPTCDGCCALRPVYRLLGADRALCAPCFAAGQVPCAETAPALVRRTGAPSCLRTGTRRPRAAIPSVRPTAGRPRSRRS